MALNEESDVSILPPAAQGEATEDLKTLKYQLLGPSLTKSGQDGVDQDKVSEVIYNASKGSKFFNNEELKDKILTQKIEQILKRKAQLDKQELNGELRNIDRLIAELEASRDLTQKIVHVDCDAFYASVELLDRPELKVLPFAVGAGVLTTCNYVARQFGCRSGMAGFVAKKLCPQLVMLKPDFKKYNAKAQEVREVLVQYDPRFESASIDEAYLNITDYCDEHNMTPEDVVHKMRREVHEKTLITVSAGIAANAKLAKICSNFNKPNGQYLLPSERDAILEFMRDLPTRKVNGIGRVLERQLLELGIKTCGDIHPQRQYLSKLFGDKAARFLIGCYLGLGRNKIQPAEEYERKSIGTESTFSETSDPEKLREKLRSTAHDLEIDMKGAGVKASTICLKAKLHTFDVYTRQAVVPRAIHLAEDLYNHSLPMLVKLEQEMPGIKLRLMGLRCTHLISTKQRPDTLAFFGLKSSSSSSTEFPPAAATTKRKAIDNNDDENNWETWPEEQEEEEEPMEPQHNPQTDPLSERTHGKEKATNHTTTTHQTETTTQWWDCPICSRPQAADEKLFNEHIDLCLSRQTIRDTIAVQANEVGNTNGSISSVGGGSAASTTTAYWDTSNKRVKGPDRKRGRLSVKDPRQKKLFFG